MPPVSDNWSGLCSVQASPSLRQTKSPSGALMETFPKTGHFPVTCTRGGVPRPPGQGCSPSARQPVRHQRPCPPLTRHSTAQLGSFPHHPAAPNIYCLQTDRFSPKELLDGILPSIKRVPQTVGNTKRQIWEICSRQSTSTSVISFVLPITW